MGWFRRKQGPGATAKLMARFPKADRELGMDMLQAAEEVFVGLGAPSRLGTALFNACAGSMGVDDESPAYGLVAGASLMGYACRMARPGRAVPDNVAAAIGGQLRFTESGALDYDALADDPARVEKLLEFTAALADDVGAVAALAQATPEAWQAFATTATYQLHRNLVRNGVPKRALPSGEALENLLRLGYALRLVDEVAGEEPASKSDLGRGDAALPPAVDAAPLASSEDPPPAEPLDVDAWVTDATGVCTHDFEPFTERVLELATLERLNILSVMDALIGERPEAELGDDVVAAMANARLGYALRNRETQLLGRSDYVAADDAIATLLDERVGGDAAINLAVVHGVLRDVLVLNILGGRENAYASTPGTTPELRRAAIEQWADEHFAGDDPRTGREVTVDLVEYGYFLHRVFEIRPDCLEDWT